MAMRILFVPIPPCHISCGRTAHAAATVENNFLVKCRLLKAVLFFKLVLVHAQRSRKVREREIDCRGDHPLQHLIRFPYIDQIRTLGRV